MLNVFRGWRAIWLTASGMYLLTLMINAPSWPTEDPIIEDWATALRQGVRLRFRVGEEVVRPFDTNLSDESVIVTAHGLCAAYGLQISNNVLSVLASREGRATPYRAPVRIATLENFCATSQIASINSEYERRWSELPARRRELLITFVLVWAIPSAALYGAVHVIVTRWWPFSDRDRNRMSVGLLVAGSGLLVAGVVGSNALVAGLGAATAVGGYFVRPGSPS
jgi:hypothetical protein